MRHLTPDLIPDFEDHLQRIQTAKKQTDAILSTVAPGYADAETVIRAAWESIFDQLCNKDTAPTELSQLNTLAGIIQKLMSSLSQIKTLEMKLHEHAMKEQTFKQKLESAKQTGEQSSLNKEPRGLTPEALKRIEEELNLL